MTAGQSLQGKTVLVLGSGGREHALAWKLSRSAQVGRVIVAPGNDGMPESFERWPLKPVRASFSELVARAKTAKVDLVVVGPDNALEEGVADAFAPSGIPCFGPSRAAARLEWSKGFAKDVMEKAKVPTARYYIARSVREAETILEALPWEGEGSGWVIKADGLALGKGVRVCGELGEALEAARELIAVSGSLVIEERLCGEELSWMAFCDGTRCALLEPARDHKRLLEGDRGPNTGGMGAFSPVPGVPEEFYARVREEVFLPTLKEMWARGTPFRGLLYAGLMVDIPARKLWVIEFNSRFGDPEAQVLLPRIDDSQVDTYDWLWACAQGDLGARPARVPFRRESAVVVVGAANGYPEAPVKGALIPAPGKTRAADGAAHLGAPQTARVPEIFFAGVERKDGGLAASGGRVLGAMGFSATLEGARAEAYARLEAHRFEGMRFRKDIGEKK